MQAEKKTEFTVPFRPSAKAVGAARRMQAPRRILKGIWENLHGSKQIDELLRWDSSGQWCLTFAGSVGCGKSFAAAYWLAMLCDRHGYDDMNNLSKCWWSGYDLIDLVTDNQARHYIKDQRWLVIDDIESATSRSKYEKGLIYSLIEARHQNERRTIITTNLGPEAFMEKLGDRAFDRINDDGTWMPCEGASLRGR